ncbi:glycoside hydrolase family 43 protein [Saccharopolyspora taberi]|uniref:Glycoside hydrolase family 43 protein n=1 Tax=Saccharopolyspora taberi TaxID=60895 RepID=A0ABN3VK53_9PSEU
MAVQVIDRNFPDPDILEHNGVFHAYATNSPDHHVQVATAARLAGPWQQRADALPRLPGWVGKNDAGSSNVWAPDVSRRPDGTFLLYYSAFHGKNRRQSIGAALCEQPGGPFTPVGAEPLIAGPERGEIIDPASFVDEDGRRYLLYRDGLDTPTIRLRPLATDGLTQTGEETVLVRADRPEENGIVEAPVLIRRPEGYVLFYSAQWFNSGKYFCNYATSTSLTGPYTKAEGAFLSRDTVGVTDPGGQDVVADGSRIVFHGDLGEPGGPRGVWVAELGWDGLRPRLG